MMLAYLAAAAAEVAAGVAEHGQKSGGLPQLNPNDFAPQLIWLAVTFALLYFLMSRAALPRVAEVLNERKERIARDIADAERLKEDTDKALADYEKALADARAKASAIAKEVNEKLTADTERERSAIDSQIASRLADAEVRIADVKAKALTSVGDIASDTASAIVKQLIGQDVPADEVKRAIVQLGK